jgi:hypothetical protein
VRRLQFSRFRLLGHRRYDELGILASTLCAIDCAAMPWLLAYLPALGIHWLAGPNVHKWMVVVCSALALSAFLPGYRAHGRIRGALFGVTGIGLLSWAAFGLHDACCPTCGADGIAHAKGTLMPPGRAAPISLHWTQQEKAMRQKARPRQDHQARCPGRR